MSLVNCEACSEVVDTDEFEMYKLDDLEVCLNCFEGIKKTTRNKMTKLNLFIFNIQKEVKKHG